MAALEDLQFTMGVGPCQDAYHTGVPVHTPRFDHGAVTRWPSFAMQARDAGIHAVFAYPLTADGAKVGVLTLYQDREGDLSAGQRDDSVMVAKGVVAEGMNAVHAPTVPTRTAAVVAHAKGPRNPEGLRVWMAAVTPGRPRTGRTGSR